jgi:hypothetical protein
METLTFTATQAGIDEDEDALVAGVATADSECYVTFQRDAKDSSEDWGVHFEFNDQINSGYECIRHCTLSRCRLHVELARPIDRQKRIVNVDVELQISDADFDTFVVMLRRIFRQRDSLLKVFPAADCAV